MYIAFAKSDPKSFEVLRKEKIPKDAWSNFFSALKGRVKIKNLTIQQKELIYSYARQRRGRKSLRSRNNKVEEDAHQQELNQPILCKDETEPCQPYQQFAFVFYTATP